MKKLVQTLCTLILLLIASCTEPYALQTDAFENVIVIEATITNELKRQEIKVSRSIPLEQTSQKFEAGAIVYIKDNLGNQYNFSQNNSTYLSDNAFTPVSGRTYQLFVTTQEGKSYTSTPEALTKVSPLQELLSEVVIKEGVKGVQIVAKSFDQTNTAKYYRYEYEETYKVIAPRWVSVKANAFNFPDPPNTSGAVTGAVEIVNRTEEARVCYSSKKSSSIILANTSNLSEDRVNLPVRFISNKDYIIMNRYSILVKQYVENLASYTYHQTLKKLSNSDNILSPTQPGFISTNLSSVSNRNEKVMGYFSVNSYSEKRVFFNFQDLFPTDQIPEYPYNCPFPIPDPPPGLSLNPEYEFLYCFDSGPDSGCSGRIILSSLISKRNVYFSGYNGIGTIPSSNGFGGIIPILVLYPIQCGDCTSFSNNIRPSFWID